MTDSDKKIVEIHFDSFEDMYKYATFNLAFGNDPKVFVFRGQGDSLWKLLPSALRTTKSGESTLQKFDNTDTSVDEKFRRVTREFCALYEFYQTANIEGLPVPDMQDFSYIDFLKSQTVPGVIVYGRLFGGKWLPQQYLHLAALAQHYGVPTRLLDWSSDFTIALYFAVRDACKRIHEEDEQGKKIDLDNTRFAVWGLNYAYFSTLSQTSKSPIKLRFVRPTYKDNPFITAQKGLFTLEEMEINSQQFVDSMPLENRIELLDLPDLGSLFGKPYLIKITLPYRESKTAFTFLQRWGYTYTRIMPSLSSVYEDIKERMLFAR